MTVHFSTWRAHTMNDVACEFARAAVRSKDAQKQLARTSLNRDFQQGKRQCPCGKGKGCIFSVGFIGPSELLVI